MTATLISLISIFIGIVGANVFGAIFKNHSFGIIGNTIAGVFGSILFIKSFGRLGINPTYIIEHNMFHFGLFISNCTVSFIGGGFAVFLISKLKKKLNQTP